MLDDLFFTVSHDIISSCPGIARTRSFLLLNHVSLLAPPIIFQDKKCLFSKDEIFIIVLSIARDPSSFPYSPQIYQSVEVKVLVTNCSTLTQQQFLDFDNTDYLNGCLKLKQKIPCHPSFIVMVSSLLYCKLAIHAVHCGVERNPGPG